MTEKNLVKVEATMKFSREKTVEVEGETEQDILENGMDKALEEWSDEIDIKYSIESVSSEPAEET